MAQGRHGGSTGDRADEGGGVAAGDDGSPQAAGPAGPAGTAGTAGTVAADPSTAAALAAGITPSRVSRKEYERELARLQTELVRMQEWIRHTGFRLVVVFEGRDTAGKGGTIKRILERLNARQCRVVALGTPTERERTQWYFQRYLAHLPAAGEIVLFDRSWYNRAGVERVMGFCTDDEYDDFLRTCPQLERALVRAGIVLVKYWLSLSDEEQERRFQERIDNPGKRWKLSAMDLQARARWVDFAAAKDEMFAYTDIREAPWHVVDADDKRTARLNLISHLLSVVPYGDVPHDRVVLPPRQEKAYQRPPIDSQTWVPRRYVRG
ncbi:MULTISPECIES: polyphosphate kinase 2 [Frankia]|uniref:polyphosphate kinase 2 n=1 Tax=Frankia TaxID=1854 RepID=UPI0002ECCAC8|nr:MULTISPECIES: polyphosphate kinase 2 [Frankia]